MRSVNTSYAVKNDNEGLAQLAASFASKGMDSYSDYGVGAVVQVDYFDEDVNDAGTREHYTHIYGGHNINLSGMQSKVHAEQIAIFQAMLDIEMSRLKEVATLDKIVIVTTENDMAVVCGHCLQVVRSICRHYGWDASEVEYIAAGYRGNEEKVENYHKSDWEIDVNRLSELLPQTYVENKD